LAEFLIVFSALTLVGRHKEHLSGLQKIE